MRRESQYAIAQQPIQTIRPPSDSPVSFRHAMLTDTIRDCLKAQALLIAQTLSQRNAIALTIFVKTGKFMLYYSAYAKRS